MDKTTEIEALIRLLDDEDKEVYKLVKTRLIDLGESVIGHLEKEWETNFNELMQLRIESIVHQIQIANVSDNLKKWRQSGARSLLEGALLIARYQYPELNLEKVSKEIGLLKKDAWVELNNTNTPIEKVRVLNHIFFGVHGYHINKKDFFSPQNNYIHEVVATKKGNPLTLSVLYITFAQAMEVPIVGVNMPENFVMCHKVNGNISSPLSMTLSPYPEVLFYINPGSGGAIFSHREIEAFLKEVQLPVEREFFLPCNNVKIIERMINNLILSYSKIGLSRKINELKKLKKCIE